MALLEYWSSQGQHWQLLHFWQELILLCFFVPLLWVEQSWVVLLVFLQLEEVHLAVHQVFHPLVEGLKVVLRPSLSFILS